MKMQGIKKLFKEHGIFSGKRVLAATLTMTMLTGMTMYAAASGHTWISQGDVKYQDANGNQTTLFAKEDLEYLDGKIDTLKADTENGKAEIATAINGYGYHKDDNIATNASYSDLASAIKTSQQIPADRTFSGTKPGETDETSGTISAATADNLSLGTAAWVDGELIVGTGADNNSYYLSGRKNMSVLRLNAIQPNGSGNTTVTQGITGLNGNYKLMDVNIVARQQTAQLLVSADGNNIFTQSYTGGNNWNTQTYTVDISGYNSISIKLTGYCTEDASRYFWIGETVIYP